MSNDPEFFKLIKLAINVLINIYLVKLPNYPFSKKISFLSLRKMDLECDYPGQLITESVTLGTSGDVRSFI